ncbi:Fe(3+) dicitrate ABC transporter substrate-binding protein [Vibrio sp. YYF0003]|uniref:Fe(3+) dicitrate ABC transporter substrate-binding protein n=1 Tax=Vibrio sp. YYF0003 TaxID=3116646 RepID=UPI002EC26DA8|nr:Fe(3+) dicitrate ABC transporter substrate-binding protein [Vibrio sp. YYF0003]
MAFMRLLTVLLVLCACTVQAASTPKYTAPTDSAPKRIVVLEYSFVDALAVIGISPVGVADDKDPTRIIPQVRDLIEPWTSVGMRSQPNLEVIAQLKPDLIIADSYRHKISLHDLSQIAPTILLKSRGETYQEGLESALAIGKAVGKEQEMKARLAKHRELMASYKGKFKANGTVQFANVNERGMWMHGPLSYTGSLLSYLGLQPALPDLKQSHLMEANLEVLLKVNPDWLFYSKRAGYAVLDNWHKSPLFKLLKINITGQEIQVSPELWSLNRGILAAESIAKELDTIIEKTST